MIFAATLAPAPAPDPEDVAGVSVAVAACRRNPLPMEVVG